MKLAVFSAKQYDREYLSISHAAHRGATSGVGIQIEFYDFALSPETVSLVQDVDAVCVSVNDTLNGSILEMLYKLGVRAVLLRCASFSNVNVPAAERLGMFVANVPSYSPETIAEFAAALVLTLSRKIHQAYNRIQEGDFSLDGLVGTTLYGKTVGLIGTGRIGMAMARIMKGFGCHLFAFDPNHASAFEQELGGQYVELDALLPKCDIISLHCPLTEKTRHIIDEANLAKMKTGAMLVNTSRSGLIDIRAVITSLRCKHLGSLALDCDRDSGDIKDELMRQICFPNVVVCNQQSFLTEETLMEIAECTLSNLDDFMNKVPCKNSLKGGSTLEKRESYSVRNV